MKFEEFKAGASTPPENRNKFITALIVFEYQGNRQEIGKEIGKEIGRK